MNLLRPNVHYLQPFWRKKNRYCACVSFVVFVLGAWKVASFCMPLCLHLHRPCEPNNWERKMDTFEFSLTIRHWQCAKSHCLAGNTIFHTLRFLGLLVPKELPLIHRKFSIGTEKRNSLFFIHRFHKLSLLYQPPISTPFCGYFGILNSSF